MNLVQFAHGILAHFEDHSKHVTKAHADYDPHPDKLQNPVNGAEQDHEEVGEEKNDGDHSEAKQEGEEQDHEEK